MSTLPTGNEDAYPPAPGVATVDIGPPGMLGSH